MVLRLVGPAHRDVPMTRGEWGYHLAEIECGPGQRYLYRIDGHERPDPASFSQPDGVHAASAVVDPAFAWTDQDWRGVEMRDVVLYELHVGSFTPGGTFDSAVAELDRLRDLGVTAVEVMPVAQCPGARNWGYDGVYLFAVQHSFGGPAGFKRFVDACHARGLGVVLDVVYNHLGPEGNYLRSFGPYFTASYHTPWGDAINFDGPGSDAVRHFFLCNALRWRDEFNLDGLRLDAVPCIKDSGAKHFLAELAEVTHRPGRPFLLIAESDLNDARLLRPAEQGGYGLDAQWSDDFHHAIHAYLTGERRGYYVDHGPAENIARALRDAYVLSGQYSRFRDRRHGAPCDDRPGEQFVIFTQNHDQVGNRLRSDRLSAMVDDESLKVIAALMILSPYVPMLFMGEEYGERAPFPYFVDHGDRGLIDQVRRGRKREFADFIGRGEPPDPATEATYRLAKVDTAHAREGRGKVLHDWHRELIRLRRTHPVLAQLDRRATAVECDGELLLMRRSLGGHEVAVLANLGTQAARTPWPVDGWRVLLESARGQGGEMPPRSVAVYERG